MTYGRRDVHRIPPQPVPGQSTRPATRTAAVPDNPDNPVGRAAPTPAPNAQPCHTRRPRSHAINRTATHTPHITPVHHTHPNPNDELRSPRKKKPPRPPARPWGPRDPECIFRRAQRFPPTPRHTRSARIPWPCRPHPKRKQGQHITTRSGNSGRNWAARTLQNTLFEAYVRGGSSGPTAAPQRPHTPPWGREGKPTGETPCTDRLPGNTGVPRENAAERRTPPAQRHAISSSTRWK